MMKASKLADSLREDILRFRKKREITIASIAYRVVTVRLQRGKTRSVYLVLQNDEVIKSFLLQQKRFIARIKSDLEKLRKRDPSGAKELDFELPFIARNCFGVTVKKYAAHSQREVTRQQAENFMGRLGKNMPKGATDFYIRSRSGYRYRLIVQDKKVAPEYALHFWNIIASEKQLHEVMAPREPIKVPAQGKSSDWRKSQGRHFLGRNKRSNGKNGNSFLYCRMKE